MKGIRIGRKQSHLPIIQGGMGVGVSLHRLAGTVASEGGIGIISTADIGFKEPDFKQSPKQANFRALQKEIEMARKISGNGILGVNIMCACADYNETVKEAVRNDIDLIISGAGLPLNLPELVNEKTAIAPIVSSARALKLLCKRWKKHYNRLPDLIIVEGTEAGGHLGFSFEELTDGNKTLDKISAEVISLAREISSENNTEIPVIVAGGIYDKNDIEHYISLGADGVQMATRFVATEECDASSEFKNAYINAEKDDIEIIHSPVGMPGRAISNAFLEKVRNVREKITHCTGCLKACHVKEAPYCITEALIRSVKGDTENGLVFCGANVSRIHEITTVKKLLQELFPNEMPVLA
ncbi:MAG: nitronate monooxygenase family protein [Ruminococcus flavefaciens]|nr:nitronate monooxygenase family protein [Ruminococcus flavefaciens]